MGKVAGAERSEETEQVELWPRFKKVKRAVFTALTSSEPGVEKTLNTFRWGGVDSGIHDHKGRVEGQVCGVELDIDIKGDTVYGEPKMLLDEKGNLTTSYSNETNIEIKGRFISHDGLQGYVKLGLTNDEIAYQAYWLQISDGDLRLEQVVSPKGVFDAELLDDIRGRVKIPGTDCEIHRYIEGFSK